MVADGRRELKYGHFGVDMIRRVSDGYEFVGLELPDCRIDSLVLGSSYLPGKKRSFEEWTSRDSDLKVVKEGGGFQTMSIPIDYGLRVAAYLKRGDDACGDIVEEVVRAVWVPDARNLFNHLSSSVRFQVGTPVDVLHGVGYGSGHPLFHRLSAPLAGDSGRIGSGAVHFIPVIEALLYENDLGRVEDVLLWSMRTSSNQVWLSRPSDQSSIDGAVLFGKDHTNSPTMSIGCVGWRFARGVRVDPDSIHVG